MHIYIYIYIIVLITSVHMYLTVWAWAGLNLHVVAKSVVQRKQCKTNALLTASFKPMHLSDLISAPHLQNNQHVVRNVAKSDKCKTKQLLLLHYAEDLAGIRV